MRNLNRYKHYAHNHNFILWISYTACHDHESSDGVATIQDAPRPLGEQGKSVALYPVDGGGVAHFFEHEGTRDAYSQRVRSAGFECDALDVDQDEAYAAHVAHQLNYMVDYAKWNNLSLSKAKENQPAIGLLVQGWINHMKETMSGEDVHSLLVSNMALYKS